MTISHDGGPEAPTAASPLLEIANAMVHLYKVALGGARLTLARGSPAPTCWW